MNHSQKLLYLIVRLPVYRIYDLPRYTRANSCVFSSGMLLLVDLLLYHYTLLYLFNDLFSFGISEAILGRMCGLVVSMLLAVLFSPYYV